MDGFMFNKKTAPAAYRAYLSRFDFVMRPELERKEQFLERIDVDPKGSLWMIGKFDRTGTFVALMRGVPIKKVCEMMLRKEIQCQKEALSHAEDVVDIDVQLPAEMCSKSTLMPDEGFFLPVPKTIVWYYYLAAFFGIAAIVGTGVAFWRKLGGNEEDLIDEAKGKAYEGAPGTQKQKVVVQMQHGAQKVEIKMGEYLSSALKRAFAATVEIRIHVVDHNREDVCYTGTMMHICDGWFLTAEHVLHHWRRSLMDKESWLTSALMDRLLIHVPKLESTLRCTMTLGNIWPLFVIRDQI